MPFFKQGTGAAIERKAAIAAIRESTPSDAESQRVAETAIEMIEAGVAEAYIGNDGCLWTRQTEFGRVIGESTI